MFTWKAQGDGVCHVYQAATKTEGRGGGQGGGARRRLEGVRWFLTYTQVQTSPAGLVPVIDAQMGVGGGGGGGGL